jgi:hypothetical protein
VKAAERDRSPVAVRESGLTGAFGDPALSGEALRTGTVRAPREKFSCQTVWFMASCPRMNIQVAVLCDAATDDNGKLNLLGAFDTIYARELPAIHPQCAVALRVTFSSEDEGKRQLKLNFVDADGRAIMPPIEIPIEVSLPGDMHFGTRNYILNIQQLKFDEPGLYSLDVMFDEKVQASIPLLVRHIQPPPPPA